MPPAAWLPLVFGLAALATAATMMVTFTRRRWRAAAKTHQVLAVVVLAVAVVAAATRVWSVVLLCAPMCAANLLLWDLAAAEPAARTPYIVDIVFAAIPRLLGVVAGWRGREWWARHWGGKFGNGWSLDEIRAEYAQTVLDDARRDPVLHALLDEIAGDVEADLAKVYGRSFAGAGRLAAITAHANLILTRALRQAGPARRPYRGYSFHSLMLAACCRLADRGR